MKLLTAVLVLLVASCNSIAGDDSSSTVVTTVGTVETSPAASASTGGLPDTTVTGGSTVPAGSDTTAVPGTGATSPAGSTVTDESKTESTVEAVTTTPTPIKLSTFPVSNNVSPMDAKLILQQAVQLDQQINALNDYLKKAQADTNPNNSPFFDQLNTFSANITAQNQTLQGYITQLNNLAASQARIDTNLTSATNTFVCFSQSSCVTDIPTTPEPTSPGPTPPVTPCKNETLSTDSDFNTSKHYSQTSKPNAVACSVAVLASQASNNVSITINVTITGPDAYVELVEKRTQISATFNGSVSNFTFSGFQEVDVFYYSGPRSTVQFDFDYIEVNNCQLNCSGHGECKVSLSGVQYCECKKCDYTGDNCETPMPNPCNGKQKRLCGENAVPQYGICYKNSCFDQCYACACSPGANATGTEQSCVKIDNPEVPVVPTGSTVCPTTSAPPTTPALLTSSIAPTVDSSSINPSTPTGQSSASTGGSTTSEAPSGTTATSVDVSTVSENSGASTATQETTQPSVDPSTSAGSSSTTDQTQG